MIHYAHAISDSICSRELVLEEMFLRGYHGQASTWPVWSDLWFAGYHLLILERFLHGYWLPPALCVLTGIAWFWRWLARRCDGMLINYASHVAADVGIVAAVWMVLR